MKNIQVLMGGCKCSERFCVLVVRAVKDNGIDARVEKVDDIMEVMQYNTMTLPALVVDGEVVARGQKNESELLRLLA